MRIHKTFPTTPNSNHFLTRAHIGTVTTYSSAFGAGFPSPQKNSSVSFVPLTNPFSLLSSTSIGLPDQQWGWGSSVPGREIALAIESVERKWRVGVEYGMGHSEDEGEGKR